jgi:hypothetical protein
LLVKIVAVSYFVSRTNEHRTSSFISLRRPESLLKKGLNKVGIAFASRTRVRIPPRYKVFGENIGMLDLISIVFVEKI